MKTFKYLLLLTVIILVSCEPNVIGDFESHDATQTEPGLNKKGVAYSYNTEAWSHKTSELAGHWFYSWGNTPVEEIPENIEYVPMFWGRWGVNQENIDRLIDLKEQGIVKYLLGFNEPDNIGQSNVTVEDALDLWPMLEQVGVPLVSPSVTGNSEGTAWLEAFMAGVEELGLRVDFIGFHNYGSSNVMSFMNRLRLEHEKYNRPIWITEFAVADWGAAIPEENRFSDVEVEEFMRLVLPALDDLEWIFRYAWFDGGTRAQLYSSRFYEEDGNLTALGAFYSQHHPNAIIGPGTDTAFIPDDPDEMVNNGDFADGVYENVGWETWSNFPNGWEGYNAGIVGSDTTEPVTGNFSLSLFIGSSAINQTITVEPETDYIFTTQSKWQNNTAPMYISIKDPITNANIGTAVAPETTEWEETIIEFTTLAGQTEIKLVFWNEGDVAYVDDVSIKKVE